MQNEFSNIENWSVSVCHCYLVAFRHNAHFQWAENLQGVYRYNIERCVYIFCEKNVTTYNLCDVEGYSDSATMSLTWCKFKMMGFAGATHVLSMMRIIHCILLSELPVRVIKVVKSR